MLKKHKDDFDLKNKRYKTKINIKKIKKGLKEGRGREKSTKNTSFPRCTIKENIGKIYIFTSCLSFTKLGSQKKKNTNIENTFSKSKA